MDETSREQERCIAIVRSQMEGASLETRRVLTRIINDIRRPEPEEPSEPADEDQHDG